MQDKLTIENLPKRILREVKDMLRGAESEAWVICRYGMLAVVRKNYYCDESMDEKLLLIIREEDLFTEDERTENYINYNHEYPSWYKGKRDRTVFRRMRKDMRLDKQAGIFYEPIGRLVNGDFVYNGEIRVHNAFELEEERRIAANQDREVADDGMTIWVDEEGRLKQPTTGFLLNGVSCVFAGNGVLLGGDASRARGVCKASPEVVALGVRWLSPDQVPPPGQS